MAKNKDNHNTDTEKVSFWFKFKKNNKEQKEAKVRKVKEERKTYFDRLADLNAKYDDDSKPKDVEIVTNKSKRTKRNIIILSLLAAGASTAIAVPLAISLTAVNEVAAYPKNENFGAVYKNGTLINGSQENYGLINTDGQSLADKAKNQREAIYREAVKYWYNEEQKSSVLYQRKYNAAIESANNGLSRRTDLALKTWDELMQEATTELNDEKENQKTTYGLEEWENKFKALLLSKYGNSKTEQEAIAYSTFKKAEKDALRRFEVQTVKMPAFLVDAVYSKNEVVVSSNGTRETIGTKGNKIFTNFKDGSVADNFNDTNAVLYFKNAFAKDDVVVLSTKSFIPKFQSAIPQFNKYVAENNVGISTNILLPGVLKGGINPTVTVDDNAKTVLANLLKFSNVLNASGNATAVSNFNYAFKKDASIPNSGFFTHTANEFIENNNSTDVSSVFETYRPLLSLSTDKFASSGVTTLNKEYLNTANFVYALANSTTDSIFNNKLNEVALLNLFKDVYTALEIPTSDVPNSSTQSSDVRASVEKINRTIDQVIKNATPDQLNKVLLSIYRATSGKLLIGNNSISSENQLSLMYKVSDLGGYLIPTNKGVLWTRRTALDKAALISLIQKDMNNIWNDRTEFLKIAQQLTRESQVPAMVNDALADVKFKASLKKSTNPEVKKLTDAQLNKIQSEIQTVNKFQSSIENSQALQNAKNFLNTEAQKVANPNVKIQNGKIVFVFGNTTQDAYTSLEGVINQVFNKEGGR
ncbi:HinT-interacting membrane complex protein P80 [Mycoplasma corogypsi]|uniref:HinT-interacting membrane complex protein P80 n=1 Tax=Mycoplasma corogypsi TaxID=2106 RepID=UPI003873415E